MAELLLTAEIYNRSENLTEDDLPPKIRKHYFDPVTRRVLTCRPLHKSHIVLICRNQFIWIDLRCFFDKLKKRTLFFFAI
ncbi:MAG: hypothetical protein PHN90_13830, partial [Methanothrix sp.]|nr:hypothetical protein [Methanothrix sp.]